MSEASLRYAVVLARPEDLKLPEIAKALSVFRKIPIQDAARLVRNCWGAPAENLSKEDAARLAACLKEAGIESLVLPHGLIEELPAASPVASIEFAPGAIQTRLKTGQNQILAKEHLRLLAAAGLKQTTVTITKVKEGPSPAQKAVSMGLLMTGLPIPIGGKSRETEQKKETTELFLYLDLCLRNPAQRFRIDAQSFNFSCLKARMGYSTPQNFRVLLIELARLFPLALRSRGAQVLLDNAPVASMGYDAIADLERESRWLLTLDALKNP